MNGVLVTQTGVQSYTEFFCAHLRYTDIYALIG